MSQESISGEARAQAKQTIKSGAWYALIPAAAMLYVAYSTEPLSSGNTAANIAGIAKEWTLWIGGAAFVLVALLCFAGLIAGLVLDVLASALSGAVLLATSIVYMWNDYLGGYFWGIFGLIFLISAKRRWSDVRSLRRTAAGSSDESGPELGDAMDRAGDKREHPGTTRPSASRGDSNAGRGRDEPEPPEGFLSALAKERDKHGD